MGCPNHKHKCKCFVIPPHMLKNVIVHGDEEQRKWAIGSLISSSKMRGKRSIMSLIPVDFPSMTGELRRTIFDAKHATLLPGTVIRSEGQSAVADIAVDEAYDGSGATYNMFKHVFGRNSMDNRGLRLDATVHYGREYSNAFWDGRQMVYGDGDGKLFNRFTVAVDIIAHELTHGVTQYTTNLEYSGQSGALNEHISDVFGVLTKQHTRNDNVSSADWLIGVGLFTSAVKGSSLRSMKDPGSAYDDPVIGKDPQPKHMNSYFNTTEDGGGVHTNSGIPNHAFYLACMHRNDQWVIAKIWYDTITVGGIHNEATFAKFADTTVRLARSTYSSAEVDAIRAGWNGVGVSV